MIEVTLAVSSGEGVYPIFSLGRGGQRSRLFSTPEPPPLCVVLPPCSKLLEPPARQAPPSAGAAPLRAGGGGAPAVLSVSALRTQPFRSRCRSASPHVSADESPPGSGRARAVGGVGRWPETNPGQTAGLTKEGTRPRREGPRRRDPRGLLSSICGTR